MKDKLTLEIEKKIKSVKKLINNKIKVLDNQIKKDEKILNSAKLFLSSLKGVEEWKQHKNQTNLVQE